MSEKVVDSRKCQRVFFTLADHVDGAITAAGPDGPMIPVKFLNLSVGGICFQATRDICQRIDLEQCITLKKTSSDLLAFLDGVTAQVKFCLDYDIVGDVTFGCEFNELPKTVLEQINKIVAARLKT